MNYELKEVKCSACGAEIKINPNQEKSFCTYCGTEYVLLKSDEDLLDKIDFAKSQLAAKNYEKVKSVAEEIQRFNPKNFYGWYFSAICAKEAPIDGKAGQFISMLNNTSASILTSVQTNKSIFGNPDKIREMNERYTKGIQTQGAITQEKFLGFVRNAINCISSHPEEEQQTLRSLITEFLSSSIVEVWDCFETKTYRKRNMVTKRSKSGGTYKVMGLNPHESQLTQMKELIFSLVQISNDTKLSESDEYKLFFEKIGVRYKEIERRLYYCTAKKELAALFADITVPEKPATEQRKYSLISLVGGICSFMGGFGIVGAIVGVVFALLSNKEYGDFDTMAKIGLGLGIGGGILSILFMFL